MTENLEFDFGFEGLDNDQIETMLRNETSPVTEVHNKWMKVSYTVIQYVVLILSILGNVLLIITLVRIRRMKNFVDKLIFNLGACNLLLVVSSIPTDILLRTSPNFPFGQFGCKIIHPVSTYAVNTGVFTLLVIAFERWKVVAQPFGAVNEGLRAALIIVTIHGCGLGSVMPYMFTLRLKLKEGKTICEEAWSYDSARIYTVVLFAVQYAVPVPIMLGFYTRAWLIVQHMNITIMKPQSPLSDCRDNNQYASTHFRTMTDRNSISIVSRCGLRRTSVFYKIQENLMNRKKEKLYHLHSSKKKPNFNSRKIDSKIFAPEPDSCKSSFRSNKNLIADFNVDRSKKEIYFPDVEAARFHNRILGEEIAERVRKMTTYPKSRRFSRKKFSVRDDIKLFNEQRKSFRRHNVGSRCQKSQTTSTQLIMNYIFPNVVLEPSTLQHRALQRRFRQSRDLLRTFTVVVMVFVIFMLPNQIYWMTLYFSHSKQNDLAINIVYILTYANCVLNPWIYGGLNSTFRKDFKHLLFRISALFKLRR